MIGLVLGETQLGRLIVNKLDKLKIKYTIIDISKKKFIKKIKVHIHFQLDSLEKHLRFLKNLSVKELFLLDRLKDQIFRSQNLI